MVTRRSREDEGGDAVDMMVMVALVVVQFVVQLVVVSFGDVQLRCLFEQLEMCWF